MPRALRNLIEGGLYHVYNRFARGEEVFSDPEEAIEFLDFLRDLKQRDDLQVFAWSLLSNHYHLAVRTSAVPLSRAMRTLQGGFSKAFDRRWVSVPGETFLTFLKFQVVSPSQSLILSLPSSWGPQD